ncbi:hypothetical protein NPIL_143061 [Nephila pilipes]|uniref:Uncharacterized protein n=1 Tax=Nephila pilipes TaxID=299642 RepID=A0A8X6NLL3_NEPPI|nr:hypothetical protein NPIL_143061 [Nephila pilipes]
MYWICCTQDAAKCVLPILEKLNAANYTFNNKKNELETNGKPDYRSNARDIFSYMMKNSQSNVILQTIPYIVHGYHERDIPMQWIGNKRLREQLIRSDANSMFEKISSQCGEQ